MNLGILQYKRGQYAEAEALLRRALELEPDNAAAHFYRGESLNRLGRVDDAMESMHRSLELRPGNARAYYALGVLYDKKQLPGQAAEMYRKARELTKR